MPLPAALQARLLKRGILKTRGESQPEEEIIAEDYDDQPSKTNNNETNEPVARIKTSNVKVASGCPNKWNVYHECTKFCFEHWGEGRVNPYPEDEKKRLRMLRKYPLPKNWEEIYDPGTGRCYYWNTMTDEVSWLPPHHPRAKISLPAAKLREIRKGKENNEPEDVEVMDVSEDKNNEDDSQDRFRSKRWDSRKSKGGRPVKKSNDLDPMDPASYSEVPRGTWSTGLERQGEAKTGADTTASGPLYQMRPYPSPGAVLRANAEMHKK